MAIQKQFVFFFILVNVHGSLLSTFNLIDGNSKIQKGFLNINLVYKKASNNDVEIDKTIIYSQEEYNGDENNEIPEDEIIDPESNIVREIEKSIINELYNYIQEQKEISENDVTIEIEEDDDKNDEKQKQKEKLNTLDAHHIPPSEKNKSFFIEDNLDGKTVNTKYDHCELKNDSNKPPPLDGDEETVSKAPLEAPTVVDDIIENKEEAKDAPANQRIDSAAKRRGKKSTDLKKNKMREDYENHLVEVLTFMFDNQHKRVTILTNFGTMMSPELYKYFKFDEEIKTLLKLINEEDAKHSKKKFLGTDIEWGFNLDFDKHSKNPSFWVYDGSDGRVSTKTQEMGAERIMRNIKQSLTNVLNRERKLTLAEKEGGEN